MIRQWSSMEAIDDLLAGLPSRAKLAKMSPLPIRRSLKIHVDRTMPFEFIAGAMSPFCSLWGAEVQFDYSDYDAALPQAGGNFSADGYILWLDWRIYAASMKAADAVDWVDARLNQIRQRTKSPIWVNNWPESLEDGGMLFGSRIGDLSWYRQLNARLMECAGSIAGCEVIDLAQAANELAVSMYDGRNQQVSQYPLSAQATVSIARHLGVHLLPSAYETRLKTIALDLDDTLYRGVLGEDGIAGIQLTGWHERLQALLLRLKQSGIMLAICSRNEEEDVKALFQARDDFPLQWKDFAVVCANWRPKPENMNEIVRRLNIAPSSILFIDDNPAELLKMNSSLPEVCLLRAYPEPDRTYQALYHYPGLYQMYADDEAAKRTADIQANQIREQERRQFANEHDYLSSLQMRLRLYYNHADHAGRVFDLSQKTNQFNLALRRMPEQEANDAMGHPFVTMTVRLTDVLSDSGIIGAFVCRIDGRQARLVETLFSCRALGRDVETVSFCHLLRTLGRKGLQHLVIEESEGPRNQPAREWIKRMTDGLSAGKEGFLLHQLLERTSQLCARHPARVEVIA